MSRPLTISERRTVAIGALLTIPALIFLFAVRPYRAALAGAREQLAAERDALAREEGAVASARLHPALQQLTDSAQQQLQPRLFTGEDEVIASAGLATYVGEVARAHHVWMQDASTRGATALVPGVRALHVDIRGETDYQGLLEFLDALERGEKSVRIDRLELSRGLSGVGNERAETLVVSATITGFAPGNVISSAAPVRRAATGEP